MIELFPDNDNSGHRQLIDDITEVVIQRNMGLVHSVARKYLGYNIPLRDLVQTGIMRQIETVMNKYEYLRGHKYSTYATWWIRQSIIRYIQDNGRTIRVPVHLTDSYMRVLKAENKYSQLNGGRPTNKELAEATGFPLNKIIKIKRTFREIRSLNEPLEVGDMLSDEFGDRLEDEISPKPGEEVEEDDFRSRVRSTIKTNVLPREYVVINLRYGLTTGESLTLEEVGRRLGVTRERVRQIEFYAFKRLRKNPETRSLLLEYLNSL